MRGIGIARLALAVALLLHTPTSALADPFVFVSRAAFVAAIPGVQVENWDWFVPGHVISNGSTAAGITYESSAGDMAVVDAVLSSTPPNSLGRADIGFFLPEDTITFSFDTAIEAFGIDINTFAMDNGHYMAWTETGEFISSIFDPFPGFETGQFLGFRTARPFQRITISAASGFSYSLDTLRHDPVPEPATLLLFATGAAWIGCAARRRSLVAQRGCRFEP